MVHGARSCAGALSVGHEAHENACVLALVWFPAALFAATRSWARFEAFAASGRHCQPAQLREPAAQGKPSGEGIVNELTSGLRQDPCPEVRPTL